MFLKDSLGVATSSLRARSKVSSFRWCQMAFLRMAAFAAWTVGTGKDIVQKVGREYKSTPENEPQGDAQMRGRFYIATPGCTLSSYAGAC